DRRRAYIVISGEPKIVIVNLDNPAAPVVAGSFTAGSSPSGVFAAADRIFISDSAQDTVSIVEAKTNRLIGEVALRIPGLENLRGLAPAGLAFHPPTGWLLVAEAGANAIAVI